jgi:hypothetical protein
MAEEEEGVEIVCPSCGDTAMAGAPIFVRPIVEELEKSGVKIDNCTRPVIEGV